LQQSLEYEKWSTEVDLEYTPQKHFVEYAPHNQHFVKAVHNSWTLNKFQNVRCSI